MWKVCLRRRELCQHNQLYCKLLIARHTCCLPEQMMSVSWRAAAVGSAVQSERKRI